MMKTMPLFAGLAFLLASALACPAFGQAAAPESLNSLKGKYAKGIKSIDAGYEQLKADALVTYGKALDETMKALKQKGDIDGYLAVEKSKKSQFFGEAPAEAEVPAALAEPLKQYHRAVAAADADRVKKMANLKDRYIAKLQEAVKVLMAQDKMDEAKLVSTEIDTVKNGPTGDILLAAAAAPASAPAAASADQLPVVNAAAGATAELPRTAPGNSPATPTPSVSTVLSLKGSGDMLAWKDTAIKVKRDDLITVTIASSQPDAKLSNMLNFSSGGKAMAPAQQQQLQPIATTVSIRDSAGGGCAATYNVTFDRFGVPHIASQPGSLKVTKDGLLQFQCGGLAVTSVQITIN